MRQRSQSAIIDTSHVNVAWLNRGNRIESILTVLIHADMD